MVGTRGSGDVDFVGRPGLRHDPVDQVGCRRKLIAEVWLTAPRQAPHQHGHRRERWHLLRGLELQSVCPCVPATTACEEPRMFCDCDCTWTDWRPPLASTRSTYVGLCPARSRAAPSNLLANSRGNSPVNNVSPSIPPLIGTVAPHAPKGALAMPVGVTGPRSFRSRSGSDQRPPEPACSARPHPRELRTRLPPLGLDDGFVVDEQTAE